MIEKRILCPERVRKIEGSFAFIEHRFFKEGFLESLSHPELLLYVFLVVAADRYGLSFYSYDRICTLLTLILDDYITARNRLIEKDLVAFDGHLFQVLSLPPKPVREAPRLLKTSEEMERHDPATVHQSIKASLES